MKRKTFSTGYFEAEDGCRIRWGCWRLPPGPDRRAVVLLNGRTEYIEKHDETARELNARGLDVFSLDWRGQGLSCRQLPDGRKGHVRSYDAYLRDLDGWFQKVSGPEITGGVTVLAHSMGGHIALRYLREYPGRIDRAVLVSPMIDLFPARVMRHLARGLTRLAVAMGKEDVYAPGSAVYDREDRKFHGNRLTSDPRRFAADRRAVAERPELAVGGVTVGWLSATFVSIDVLQGAGYPEAIRTPLCVVGAGREQVVSPAAQEAICTRIPNGRFFRIPGARHEILRESDRFRSRFWEIFDAFAGGTPDG